MRQAPDLPAAFNEQGLKALCGEPLPKTTLSYQCELLTPMYGGGVEPGQVDKEMPIRATAIRGQLRFWWRLLFGNSQDSKDSFLREREIWGGLGDEQSGDLRASAVLLSISQNSMTAKTEVSQKSYAYGPACNNPDVKWLSPGYKWALTIHCPEELVKVIELTVRWWATFGGVGSRSRRGFGAVLVDGIETITPKDPLYGCEMKINAAQHATPIDAWRDAYGKLYEFRQGDAVGRTKRFGQSNWPEPDAIRNLSTHSSRHVPRHPHKDTFPRAQFGLPLIFKFKDGDVAQGDPQTSTLLPEGAERYASPLIVRPYYSVRTKKWHPLAFLLPNWQESFALALTLPGKSADLPNGTSWQLSPEISSTLKPLQNRGTDALSAFCTYFVHDKPSQGRNTRVAPPPPPPPPKPADAQSTAWGKCRVQLNRVNGALTVTNEEGNKTGAATGAEAETLLKQIPDDQRKNLLERGGINLLVTVVGGTIKKLEAPAP